MHSWEHLAMTPDHWNHDLLPEFGELPIRHLQRRLQFVDGRIPLVLWQERKVPPHLSECHRAVHVLYGPVGLIKQRLGISYDRICDGSNWTTPFGAGLACLSTQFPLPQV